jgi:hypothetical protein
METAPGSTGLGTSPEIGRALGSSRNADNEFSGCHVPCDNRSRADTRAAPNRHPRHDTNTVAEPHLILDHHGARWNTMRSAINDDDVTAQSTACPNGHRRAGEDLSVAIQISAITDSDERIWTIKIKSDLIVEGHAVSDLNPGAGEMRYEEAAADPKRIG